MLVYCAIEINFEGPPHDFEMDVISKPTMFIFYMLFSPLLTSVWEQRHVRYLVQFSKKNI